MSNEGIYYLHLISKNIDQFYVLIYFYTTNYTLCVTFVSLLSFSVFFSFCSFSSMSLTDNSLILLGILQLSSPGDGLLLKLIACSIVSGNPSPVVSGRNTPKQPAIIAMMPITKFGAGFQ